MELFKNIFFNTDKVVENTDVRVTYAGKLFQNGSEDVIVHYGFGENWENAQDVVMQKSELGYQVDIHVLPNTKLNFCFRNSIGEWDNNEGSNYAFKIEKEGYNQYTGTQNVVGGVTGSTTGYTAGSVTGYTTGSVTGGITGSITGGITQNVTEGTTGSVAENESLTKITPTWGELFKKTFNNFVNYFSKLFSTNKGQQTTNINNK